jgi:predicted nucleic acid-binding protein
VPEVPLLRVFLDSNVLFSASRDLASRFLGFWRLRDTAIITSHYVVDEVSRNIKTADQRRRFEVLLAQTEFVSDADVRMIPADIGMVAKDQPILAAAIAASVDYLATADKKHFAHLYGTRVSGVLIMNPASFLDMHEDRLPE